MPGGSGIRFGSRSRSAFCGGIVALVALVGLLALRHEAQPALSRPVAVADAMRAMRGLSGWAEVRWDHASVGAIDGTLTRVVFWDGPQIAGQVALNRDGTPAQVVLDAQRSVPFGNWLAYQPGLLVLLGGLFVLACGVTPLRRRRNLDVMAALSLVVPVVLLAHRYLAASVVSGLPGLLWLAARGVGCWLGGERTVAPHAPLLDALTPRWSVPARLRLLRLALVALGLVYLMVAVSSTEPVDVVYGVMEGATKLIGGILPYGHLPGDVIHGDTYPIASYALYAPLAWLAPVRSTWDGVDLALGVTAVLGLVAAWFSRVGARRAAGPDAAERSAAGLRAALAWLSFPPLLVAVSSGTTDVLLAVLVLAGLLAWRRPGMSAGLITLAGWVKLAPFALLPLWLLSRQRRERRIVTVAATAVSLAALGLVVALGGVAGLGAMLHGVAFQLSRGSPQSVWSVLPIAWLQPVAQAALLGALTCAVLDARRRPELLAEPSRVAGLTLAVLSCLELVGDFWSVLYLVWIAVLLPVSVLRPATAAAEGIEVRERSAVVPATVAPV